MGVAAQTSFIIPINETESNVVVFDLDDDIAGMWIYGPEALTGIVTVYVYPPGVGYEDPANRRRMKSAGDPITIAAGDAEPILFRGYGAMQLISDAAETAQREFRHSISTAGRK